MILLASIGNTNLTYGLFEQGLIVSERFPIADLPGQSDFDRLFRSLLEKYLPARRRLEGAALSSVVPEKTPLLLRSVQSVVFPEPLLISERTSWTFDRSAYTGVLGTDRLLCCQAALQKYRPPLVAIDCGTATTLNVVDQSGSFVGGVILPGVLTGIQAVAARAALLAPISSVSRPGSVIGKNTAECMLSGAVYGAAAQLEGLVARIGRALRQEAAVILTGGNAEAILPYLSLPLHFEPDLLLEGLAQKYEEHGAGCRSREDAL